MYVEGVVSSVRRDDVFDYIQFKVLDDTVELEVREVGFDKGTLGDQENCTLASYLSPDNGVSLKRPVHLFFGFCI